MRENEELRMNYKRRFDNAFAASFFAGVEKVKPARAAAVAWCMPSRYRSARQAHAVIKFMIRYLRLGLRLYDRLVTTFRVGLISGWL